MQMTHLSYTQNNFKRMTNPAQHSNFKVEADDKCIPDEPDDTPNTVLQQQ